MSAEMTLPEEWVETNLGRILELKYGKSLPDKSRDGIGFPVYGSNGKVGLHSQAFVNKEGIIVGRKGSYGEVQYSATPFSPIDTTYFIDEYWNQPISFWFYQLKKLPLTSLNRSTAIPGLNREDAYEQKVALPPLAEQHQIAQRLDELLAQVDTIKARLDAIPAILKRFHQSVLSAAVSGKLTEEWRSNNNYTDPWLELKVKNIVTKVEAGKSLKCIETPPQNDEYGIIKISAVTWGIFDENESKTLPNRNLFIEDRRVNAGDFLISRANTIELLGNPVIVEKVTKNLMLSDKVLRLVMDDKNKRWLSLFLRSSVGRYEIESRSTGNQLSMRNIGQSSLLDIDLPKPSDKEQEEIVRRVDQFFAFADQIEQRVNDAKARVDKLTQSILAKAFRGELTADWRAEHPELISGENSAEALLAKIQAAKAALEGKKKKGKAA